MAAKLLHSLTDDNIDLQKQIGCMTGIFQLFDGTHIITGGRRVVGTTRKSPPSDISEFNGGNSESEMNYEHLRLAITEKIPFKNIQEKQRISTESSRASFSSLSRSSSSSSLECRPTHLEHASFDRISFSESPSMGLQNSLPQFSQPSRDLRDLVKDSMYREIHNLSVKPRTAEEAAYRESPRLSSESSVLDTKQQMQDDLKESLRFLAKYQEPPRHQNERRELLRSYSYQARDSSSSLNFTDAPRFSYDGREINRAPFDSRDVSKSTQKLRDLPRLSLDGSKNRSSYSDPKSNFLKSMQIDSSEFDGKVQNLREISGNQARPTSVVAKLMGLETLPLSAPHTDTNSSVTKSYQNREFSVVSGSFGEREASSVKLPSSSKSAWKEPTSPRWRNTDIPMKPLSRFPVEPAPWKHSDGRNQKPRSRNARAPVKAETAFPSVYSEIEKRLKDLEFTQSGKDLRALKQILEAMQSKKLLQSQKDLNFTSGKEQEERQLRFKHEAKSRKPQSIAAQRNESPIVIMKSARPAASVASLEGLSGVAKVQDSEFVDSRKSLSSGRTAKDVKNDSEFVDSRKSLSSSRTAKDVKNNRTLKATQTSIRSQQVGKDGHAGLGKNSGSISPRLQQKKLELEKRARPPTPPDSSKSRRQPNKQQGESSSPGGRRRPKHSNIQESGEKLSDESRTLNYHENKNLVEPNSSVTTCESMLSGSAEEISTIALNEEKSVEYSSPVSVLDNRIHKDDLLSSVTYKGEISMDKEKVLNVVQQREFGFTSDINRSKLQNIENLVQKLRRLNSSHDEAGTDYIASLCENTDPDHRYISEILLASGLLLRDLGSSLIDFQFHPSGHPINPELFLVLEQTKASSEKKMQIIIKGKLQRKLLFDTVNEILARKLSPSPSTEPSLRPLMLTRTALNAQKLLRVLCAEIEVLQCREAKCSSEEGQWKDVVCKDVMQNNSERWTDFDDEISGAVLNIERSIFKDLVNEIVIGESAGLKSKPAGNRLRSFAV